MKNISFGLDTIQNQFQCNPRNYKKTRLPKKFLIDRIKRELQHAEIKCGKLLDIGCGNGAYINELSPKLNMSFIGVDISKEMLAHASTDNSSVYFVNASFNKILPFQSNSFNAIISVDSIHFSENLDLLLREVNRILISGGIFIICTHTQEDLNQQTLGIFFPKTIDIEICAAKRMDRIASRARNAGLTRLSRHRDVIKFSPDRSHIEIFSKKCASVLHHISNFEFKNGLNKLKRAAATKMRVAAHSYTTITFQKPFI